MNEYEWRVERDAGDGLTYITHRRWSLVGQGKDIVGAAEDLAEEITSTYAQYAGRSDLSPSALAMVSWMEDTLGLSCG